MVLLVQQSLFLVLVYERENPPVEARKSISFEEQQMIQEKNIPANGAEEDRKQECVEE
jgi:hypothetical protein